MTSSRPFAVIPRSIFRMVSGVTTYPPDHVGSTITLDDGRQYRVFREVIMRNDPPQAAGGVFRVWFYAMTTIRQTILMSELTKLFFVGMPGFRSKLWMVNDKTQEFGGIYQFDTVEHACDYAHSFAMGLSKRRSRPGMFAVEYYAKDGEASLYRAQEKPIVAGEFVRA